MARYCSGISISAWSANWVSRRTALPPWRCAYGNDRKQGSSVWEMRGFLVNNSRDMDAPAK
eukprot:363801-Chlamydomonas_euryale.AAC.13